jgi:nucleotide-binding universal stress UspA family protein
MYRSILVPLDGSAFGEHALPIARGIARRCGATLHLAHAHVAPVAYDIEGVAVTDVGLDAELRAQEETYLASLQAQAIGVLKIDTQSALLEAPVADALVSEVEHTGADLVVMTTHGRGGLTRMWLGSVADGLVHQVCVPVLLVRPEDAPVEPWEGFKHMLIALDGSALAERILEPAIDLGSISGCRYTLLHVVEPLLFSSYSPTSFPPRLAYDAARCRRDEAQVYLESVAAQMRARGLQVDTQVEVEQQPASGIVKWAAQNRPDAIAMATHGRGGAGRVLIGSVADKVLRSADCPVLLEHPGARHGRTVAHAMAAAATS